MNLDSLTQNEDNSRDKVEVVSTNLLPRVDNIIHITKGSSRDFGKHDFFVQNKEVIRLGKMRKLGWSSTWKNKVCVLSARDGELFLSFYNSVRDSVDSQSKGNGGIHILKDSRAVQLSVEKATDLNAPYTNSCFSIIVNSRKCTFFTETVTCM